MRHPRSEYPQQQAQQPRALQQPPAPRNSAPPRAAPPALPQGAQQRQERIDRENAGIAARLANIEAPRSRATSAAPTFSRVRAVLPSCFLLTQGVSQRSTERSARAQGPAGLRRKTEACTAEGLPPLKFRHCKKAVHVPFNINNKLIVSVLYQRLSYRYPMRFFFFLSATAFWFLKGALLYI